MKVEMGTMRLLLVDDEFDFRNALARRLGRRGLNPKQAANGEECLAMLAEQPVDVVVLDVKMPGLNGIEVLNHIKKKYPQTEVILLTGQATTSDGVEGIKTGAFDYLTKPIELDHLISKIEQAYGKIQREEEKIKEAEFRDRMERQMIATERLASLGTLAAGVAHEINNPLAIIRESAGWMNLVLKRKELSEIPHRETFYKALEKIENAVERAKKITHQLLGFAKESDAIIAEINFKELVNEAIQLVIREAADKHIQIIQETDSFEGSIWSDPYQLRQVLINLLTNAIHATGKNGKIYINLQPAGHDIALTVKDTGIGIPKENLNRIFEPFFTTKSPDKGTGLGLFVTRSIVEKLGGKIEVDSRLGQGASFRVVLPRYHKTDKGLNEDGLSNILKEIQGGLSND